MYDLLVDAQDKINDAELILCDLLNSGIVDEDGEEAVEKIKELIAKCEKLQIECMGVA